MDKLTQKWIEKIQSNDGLTVLDLYEFSKIKLRTSRMRKKFNKYYYRYITEEVCNTYWGVCIAGPLVNSFKRSLDLSKDLINIEPMEDTPNVELIYSDYQYKTE